MIKKLYFLIASFNVVVNSAWGVTFFGSHPVLGKNIYQINDLLSDDLLLISDIINDQSLLTNQFTFSAAEGRAPYVSRRSSQFV